MKRSLFITLVACAAGCLWEGGAASARNFENADNAGDAQTSGNVTTAREIYEWRVYALAPGADTELFDAFVRDALIPAYGRHGIEVGAFAPAEDYPEFPAGARYLFLAWPDMDTYRRVSRSVREDAGFLAAGVGYFDASAPKPVYTALETYLCEAFDAIPRMRRPSAERGLFEFRVYRSPNAEANERKIKMFEQGEIAVFDETGINVVCFGRTLAGPRMPSLVYLTWHKDAPTRREAWDRFGKHPEWVRMRSLPEYAHTATDNLVRLLTPLPWSKY